MYVLCVDGRGGYGGVGEGGIAEMGDDYMEGDGGKFYICTGVDCRGVSGGVGEGGIAKVGDDNMEGERGNSDVCNMSGWQRKFWWSG